MGGGMAVGKGCGEAEGKGSAAGKSYGERAGIGAGRGTACGGVATVIKRAINPSGLGVGGGTACGTYELGHGTAKGEGVGNGKG